ncbi:MAG TPA: hypothetical protein VGO58_10450 [Chitinophagaceae bacterium]|jgi:hypothetical protein|nr:hypothetical protein [Chitinophagaceae bacterium]
MKKVFSPIFFACLLLTSSLKAQPTISKQEHQAKLVLLKKDTAYQRFHDKLTALLETAKGRNTNFAAVQKLFTANKPMLTGLKKRYNLPGAGMTLHNNNQYIVNEDRPVAQVATNTNAVTTLTRVVNGPFVLAHTSPAGQNPWVVEQQGRKIIWTLSGDEETFDLGGTAVYAVAVVTVPDDPKILSVMIDFEYTLFTTGWDTEGGVIAPMLGVLVYGGLNSFSYDHWRTTGIHVANNYQQIFKHFKTFFTKEFDGPGQYTESRSKNTFGFGGNVVPGQTIYLKVAIGYDTNSNHTGDFGVYHYGEFELNKITLRYSKGSE